VRVSYVESLGLLVRKTSNSETEVATVHVSSGMENIGFLLSCEKDINLGNDASKLTLGLARLLSREELSLTECIRSQRKRSICGPGTLVPDRRSSTLKAM
jgi:hypothetical protein